ncbi:hypothetical protein LZ480_07800 [Solibacillus sp. MA9]|uniref:Fibronectin type-III domain-containing protein n=1 Tax=Solibacillus palustris TaxID=2908203 RepID=A0ABS9UBR7_9BACL|nr:hypothetical protein [Solibacillus sp. MA9]MCH7321796.1 hypothetical protein [Solibacillus sp. MA9]
MALAYAWNRYNISTGGLKINWSLLGSNVRIASHENYHSSINTPGYEGEYTFSTSGLTAINGRNLQVGGTYYQIPYNNLRATRQVVKVNNVSTGGDLLADLYEARYTDIVTGGQSQGSYVGQVTSASRSAYPDNAVSGGYWYVYAGTVNVNTAPTTPGAFTQPTGKMNGGETVSIAWGPSSDADGNQITYFPEYRYYKNGVAQTWTALVNSTSLTRTLTLLSDDTIDKVDFRVRAFDGSAYSGYRNSTIFNVEHNSIPTVSLTAPSDNQTLYENDTLNIAGNAHDADPDQSVTAYYQINNEQRKVLATNLSQTQIALSKQLTFKGGKLYDGETVITGDLADGVAHTLKVWAEDSEKATSAIIERAFYVVPNRAPLLTVDAVVPSGVVDMDKFTINGNASDQDANSNVTVTRRINAGNSVEIYNGPGGAWEFEVSLAQLVVGQNTIIIEVVDNYGAKTSKTIKLNKNEIKTPILQSVARYKIEPPKGSAKGVLLWIQRDEGLQISAELSMTLKGEQELYVPLSANSTDPVYEGVVEDEFYHETLEPKDNIILKLTTTRANTNIDNKIYLIMGVLE